MTVSTIPAATLVLFRSNPAGDPDLLMIERAGGMTFAAGAMVFPGGRVDPGDRAMAEAIAPGAEPIEMAARIAAIRETIEEVGIAVGLISSDVSPSGGAVADAAAVARLRQGLAAGTDFAALLEEEGLRLDPAMLTPFARWQPDMHPTRNFDTYFFAAAAPADATAAPDGGESVHAVWATARSLLDQADAGRHHMIFPTRRNLERLAAFGSLDALCRQAAAGPITPITPWIEDRDGTPWLCIPDDQGYPVTAEPVATALRG